MLGFEVRDAKRSAGAMKSVGASLLIFSLSEIWQHVVIRPAGIAELAPQIEILALSADIDQAVDRRGTAKNLAARPRDAAIEHLWHRFGLEIPGDLGVVDVAVETGRDVDPRVGVLAACLKQ